MKTSSDNDLRHLFQAQRQVECEHAPWFPPASLQGPDQGRTKQPLRWPVLALPAGAAALLGLVVWLALPVRSPRLVEALPVLLDRPESSLFAGIETGAPSDFFLPSHLQLKLP